MQSIWVLLYRHGDIQDFLLIPHGLCSFAQLCSFHISWPQLSWFYCLNCLYQFSYNCTEITFNSFYLHSTKHENNTATKNTWSSDYISQKTDNQVLGNKNSEHTNQREVLISEGIIKTETILQHICGHSIATSGYLRLPKIWIYWFLVPRQILED